MSKILVLGGGIVGLSTAMMLARRGHDVTVFERDSKPLPASPEDAWQRWERRGVAQFRQPHYLHPARNRAPRFPSARREAGVDPCWLHHARPGVVDRIMQVVSTHEAVIPPGPSREELLRMLHSERREIQRVPA